MCGITGIIKKKSTDIVNEKVLTKMRDSMYHRGPDGYGNWISDDSRVGLAHRRLSIIDLNENAGQPMSDINGQVWISFNGEIYNHHLLRAELEKECFFKTDHSDTEVLIHGYIKWGINGLLERIEGDFAFALWDDKGEELFIVRDRAGVKPVYFFSDDNQFIFASEIKAILADLSVPRAVEPIAMYHYLSFMTTPAPFTMFKSIYKLPAGFVMRISKNGSIKAWKYWDSLPKKNKEKESTIKLSKKAQEEFYLKGIKSKLEASVEKRMMSDVPFGVFLSGGVDSSTNVALMNQFSSKPLNSFTVGFKDFHHLNELEHASTISKKFGTNHHEILIDENDMLSYLNSLIHHQDEPIADWVCIPLYYVSKLAKDNGVTVIQVGEGSDEQFCGYAGYMEYLKLYYNYFLPFQNYLPQPVKNFAAYTAKGLAKMKPSLAVYSDIIDRAARDREHFWTGAIVFWDVLKNQLLNKSANWSSNIHNSVKQSGLIPESYLVPDSFNIISSFLTDLDKHYPNQDILTRMIYNEFKLRLPELLLMRVDKVSMSESLEARVPFLDHDLIEFTMNIPEKWKIYNGIPKYLLKKAVEDLLPHEIIYRKKMGFGAPMADWLRGKFGYQCRRLILNSSLLKLGFFNVDYIHKLFDFHISKKMDNSVYIWTIYNLTAWYDYWIEKP